MGILDRLSPSAQFIEVIEWLDDSTDTMLYRFPVRDQEIKNGAQLIVRESQSAVFVHEGQKLFRMPVPSLGSELCSLTLLCNLRNLWILFPTLKLETRNCILVPAAS